MLQRKLNRLRSRLNRLRRRRRLVRWTAAYSSLALTAVLVLGLAFLVDLTFEMDRLQRIILLAICAGVLLWSFRRYTLPWLGRKESLLDVALLVEKHEGIDSDLVAALQFEQPEAAQWGSEQLEQAVVDRVAELGNWLNIFRGFAPVSLGRRLALLVAACGLFIALGLVLPEYLAVFFNRLLLGSRHYPTKTVIERLAVNGKLIDLHSPGRTPVAAPYGKPVRFEAVCQGLLPASGRADLKAMLSGLHTSLTLQQATGKTGQYLGEAPRLVESVEYQVYLGDAWLDPARIIITPLPVADLEIEVVPPSYMTGASGPQRMPKGMRQVSVVEGSEVRFHLTCDKRLQSAALTIGEKQHSFELAKPLARQGDKADKGRAASESWSFVGLPPVVSPVRYTVQVIDGDGLQLENPIQGVIRVKPDNRPLIAGAIVTPYVLPVARPTIYYEARDDYGLASVTLDCEITRENGATRQEQIEVFRVSGKAKPRRELDEQHAFDLSPLRLAKGDRLEVTLRAVDYRGPREGQAGRSEPIVFQVTDEQGILAMMMESDRKSAQQLKSMIARQLGIGGTQ